MFKTIDEKIYSTKEEIEYAKEEIEYAKEEIEYAKEEIEYAKEEMRQLENRKARIMQANKTQERKARTCRLIERGAILECFIEDAETLTNEQIKSILKDVFEVNAGSVTQKGTQEQAPTS